MRTLVFASLLVVACSPTTIAVPVSFAEISALQSHLYVPERQILDSELATAAEMEAAIARGVVQR